MSKTESTEDTGEKFNVEKFLYARVQAWQGLYELAKAIKPGDTEEKISKTFLDFFPFQTKSWHPPKIRFATDTQCSFREVSPLKLPIKEGDFFFFDFGPVIDEHEADVGDTFCLGNPDFINPAKLIFEECEKLWLENGLSGVALYQKACEFAEARELQINPKMIGHRLGDFPHALHHKGALGDFKARPKELLWVLEVHVLDSKNRCGYFYEDILGSAKS